MAAKRGLGWQPEHREIEIIIRSAYDWHQSNHALKHAS
jgi:UDP-glucose 4-epimerase